MPTAFKPPPYPVLVITESEADAQWIARQERLSEDAAAAFVDGCCGALAPGALASDEPHLRTNVFHYTICPSARAAEGLLARLTGDVLVLLFREGGEMASVLARLSRVPIISVGERSGARAAQQAIQAGATDYLERGATPPGGLERSLRMALERGRHSQRVKRTAEGSRERARQLERLTARSPIGLVLLDPDTTVAFANPAAIAMLGLRLDQLLGQRWWFEVEPHEVAEYVSVRGGEAVTLDVRAEPLDASGRSLVISLVDATPHRWVGHAYTDLLADTRLQRDDWDRFVGNLRHDLAAPVRGLRLYLQLLDRRIHDDLDAEASDLLGSALHASASLRDMLRDLRDYAGIRRVAEATPVAPVDLAALLADVLENLAPALEEADAEVTNVPLPVVMGAEGQLRRVWLNLLTNAIKFRSAEPLRIRIDASALEAEWVFSLADNGMGIAPVHLSRIFAPFERGPVDRDRGGSGLGLAISRRIVEEHGGRIWAVAAPKRGATFFFTLPRAAISPQQTEAAPPTIPAAGPS